MEVCLSSENQKFNHSFLVLTDAKTQNIFICLSSAYDHPAPARSTSWQWPPKTRPSWLRLAAAATCQRSQMAPDEWRTTSRTWSSTATPSSILCSSWPRSTLWWLWQTGTGQFPLPRSQHCGRNLFCNETRWYLWSCPVLSHSKLLNLVSKHLHLISVKLHAEGPSLRFLCVLTLWAGKCKCLTLFIPTSSPTARTQTTQ